VWLHLFVTSALDGDEWSTSSSRRFTPRKKAGTRYVEERVNARARLGVL
jgi:hypothetical protein